MVLEQVQCGFLWDAAAHWCSLRILQVNTLPSSNSHLQYYAYYSEHMRKANTLCILIHHKSASFLLWPLSNPPEDKTSKRSSFGLTVIPLPSTVLTIRPMCYNSYQPKQSQPTMLQNCRKQEGQYFSVKAVKANISMARWSAVTIWKWWVQYLVFNDVFFPIWIVIASAITMQSWWKKERRKKKKEVRRKKGVRRETICQFYDLLVWYFSDVHQS